MKISSARIPDVLVIEPDVFIDERGFFMETWQQRRFAEQGCHWQFVQDNYSRSVRGTVRGLHYQVGPPQGKLVRVTVGEVFDVAVDLRKGSPTFAQWVGHVLSAENQRMLWVPPGFAHGFCVLSDVAECAYKCTAYYSRELERGIRWDDPALGITWPSHAPVVLSTKDRHAPLLAHAEYLE